MYRQWNLYYINSIIPFLINSVIYPHPCIKYRNIVTLLILLYVILVVTNTSLYK